MFSIIIKTKRSKINYIVKGDSKEEAIRNLQKDIKENDKITSILSVEKIDGFKKLF